MRKPFAILLALSLVGCVRFWNSAELLERKIQCAIAHQDLPDVQILLECAIDPKDAENILNIINGSRERTAIAVIRARAHEQELRWNACSDGGAF